MPRYRAADRRRRPGRDHLPLVQLRDRPPERAHPTSRSTGGSVQVSVSTDSECAWSASSLGVSWISVSPAAGTGPGTVTVSVAANATTLPPPGKDHQHRHAILQGHAVSDRPLIGDQARRAEWHSVRRPSRTAWMRGDPARACIVGGRRGDRGSPRRRHAAVAGPAISRPPSSRAADREALVSLRIAIARLVTRPPGPLPRWVREGAADRANPRKSMAAPGVPRRGGCAGEGRPRLPGGAIALVSRRRLRSVRGPGGHLLVRVLATRRVRLRTAS